MCEGVIENEFVEFDQAEIARLAGVDEAQLEKWVDQKVVVQESNVYAVIDAAAAAILAEVGVRDGWLLRFTKLVSEHLVFHVFDVCPKAIATQRQGAHGKLVHAPRHMGIMANAFAASLDHEPYRFALLQYGMCIQLAGRAQSRFPDGSRAHVTLDLRRIARTIAGRLRQPLVVSVYRPAERTRKSADRARRITLDKTEIGREADGSTGMPNNLSNFPAIG
ncbi:hypothetical protein Mesau_06008 [Mesorhizobium australicum WSM2073]|uniref:Uncharacterized protein n=1 Tax=Mesorhizobium australicum (strain HAMBI 3006 / LMG 24608 / WSM2073) TaxID=754035 RepID=L0KS10_MESAW|nr:hypothetical protein [Mesorhizobium australicum]AGB48227.1 hypothetical protein Mesau_06008 [Mesorhizobium australicum WSM2073]